MNNEIDNLLYKKNIFKNMLEKCNDVMVSDYCKELINEAHKRTTSEIIEKLKEEVKNDK